MQRADDDEAVVLERLKVYRGRPEPLVEYYRVRPTFRVGEWRAGAGSRGDELDTMIHDAVNAGTATVRRTESSGDRLPVAGELEQLRAGDRLVGEVLERVTARSRRA